MNSIKKQELRSQILEIRNQMKYDKIQTAEQKLFSQLLSINTFSSELSLHRFKNVMLYMDFKNEMPTKKLINYLFENQQSVIIPSVESGHIIPYHIPSIEGLLIDSYGIPSPDPFTAKIIDPKCIDLVFVPGVVFDKAGNRVGFGKGYYDQFLPTIRNDAIKVGLSYEFQVVNHVPADSHDIQMDYILTEKQLVQCQ